ncbi:VOC family protein [Acetobacterium sp.]|uniref:VOC family protein n=1 Tax=Acetobacterium sp. TaxID=1872094 RepID=UPI002F429D13
MKFSWVTVMVNHMEESLKFYTEIVGLEVNRRFNAGPEMEIAFLGDGETQVELIGGAVTKEVRIGEDISLGFQVSSVDETMEIIKQKGTAIHSGPFQPNPHIKYFYVTDPNGLKIQFVENL